MSKNAFKGVISLDVRVSNPDRGPYLPPHVEIRDAECEGVIFAHGSRFGGHSLFIKDEKLRYELKPGKHARGLEFIRKKPGPAGGGSARRRAASTAFASTATAATL